MNSEKCCANCSFFEARNKFCRRFPPKPIVIDAAKSYSTSKKDFVISKYPVVSMPDLDWCGEFQEKGKQILL